MGTERWQRHIRHTFQRYDETLLRQVAHKLCKPRNQWPVDEILDRVVSAFGNAAMLDRRLKDLPAPCRQILSVIGQSRQPRWPVGSLVELLVALGAEDGLAPLVALLEAGLLLPELFPFGTIPDADKLNARTKLRSFESWLGRSEPMPMLLAAPVVTNRVLREDLGLSCPAAKADKDAPVLEADGLDWPLRLAVLWQQVLDAPLRRTQQGDYFKRDYDRLQTDPLLSAAPTDVLAPIPNPGFCAAALASASGLLRAQQAELHTGEFSAAWKAPLSAVLAELWSAWLHVRSWNPAAGHAPDAGPGNPYPSACLLALLLLAELNEKKWAAPADIDAWIAQRHPYWRGAKNASPGIAAFLLGIAYTLRLIQATKTADGWLVRLSPTGRWMLRQSEHAPAPTGFPRTLLVQPNLEILAYRQGLTPELIAGLSRIASWRGLGPACTLQLEPHSVYRALEMGESYASIVQLLEGHGTKAAPTAVLDSLKTWSSKRERLAVYSAGAIFEFATPAELNEAIARGLPAARLTDKLAIVASESAIDFAHFRLTGTRDYALPPAKCVEVEADGVTLSVDVSRSDLLLETELLRFSEPACSSPLPAGEGAGVKAERRCYRVTPASILSARQQGVTLMYLQTWFVQRTGLPITAALHLLMTSPEIGPVELRRQLVLHLPNEHLADGLQQWPGTRALIQGRLGPTTLVVEGQDVPALRERLQELGLQGLKES